MSLTNGLLELPEKMTRSDSVSAMRGLLQRGCGAGLPARGRGGLGGRASARHLAVVLREDDLLHPLARLAVQRVRDVLERAVLAALRRHRDEQAGVAVDHFEVAHDETVVERDRHVGFQPFLVYRKDPHLGDLHDATPLDATPPTEQTAADRSARPDELSNGRLPASGEGQGKFARAFRAMSIDTSAFHAPGPGAVPVAWIWSTRSWVDALITVTRSTPLLVRRMRWSAAPSRVLSKSAITTQLLAVAQGSAPGVAGGFKAARRVTVLTAENEAPACGCSANAASFTVRDVFTVAGPRSVVGLSNGWSPNETVNVFWPLTWTTPSGTPPGMQFPLAPQRLWDIVMLSPSNWA